MRTPCYERLTAVFSALVGITLAVDGVVLFGLVLFYTARGEAQRVFGISEPPAAIVATTGVALGVILLWIAALRWRAVRWLWGLAWIAATVGFNAFLRSLQLYSSLDRLIYGGLGMRLSEQIMPGFILASQVWFVLGPSWVTSYACKGITPNVRGGSAVWHALGVIGLVAASSACVTVGGRLVLGICRDMASPNWASSGTLSGDLVDCLSVLASLSVLGLVVSCWGSMVRSGDTWWLWMLAWAVVVLVVLLSVGFPRSVLLGWQWAREAPGPLWLLLGVLGLAQIWVAWRARPTAPG